MATSMRPYNYPALTRGRCVQPFPINASDGTLAGKVKRRWELLQ